MVGEDGELVYFKESHQFMNKIFNYDEDIQEIINELFLNHSLENPESDCHFKKTFLFRFNQKQINRQTIESFQLELVNTFLTNEHYINQVYQDLDKFLTNQSTSTQENSQLDKGNTSSDNRQAFADLPQNSVNIDVDNTEMKSATDNTISRNKQSNNQESEGQTLTENKAYQLDQLIKSNTLMEEIFLTFDKKCFMQVF